MVVSKTNAMLPVAMMKLMDQRFLLMGMTPSFREKPERPPASRPVRRAQTSQRTTWE